MKIFQFVNMASFMGIARKINSLLFSSVGKVQNSCDSGFIPWKESAAQRVRERDL